MNKQDELQTLRDENRRLKEVLEIIADGFCDTPFGRKHYERFKLTRLAAEAIKETQNE